MSREVLWRPDPAAAEATRMAGFIRWLEADQGRRFEDYNDLWRWSVAEIETFWDALVRFSGLQFSEPPREVLPERVMPGADWFPGARLNYADRILARCAIGGEAPALISVSETFGREEVSWAELGRRVAALAETLREMGVGKGDRVVAILPNTPDACVALLATVSIGAIWSLCAPDMGHVAILDRFRQIEPKVLIAQDGYVHGGRTVDRREVLATIEAGLPTVEHFVRRAVVGEVPEGHHDWSALLDRMAAPLVSEQVAFSDPLWVVYSSGTTGNPKPIVHGHGGVTLEGIKQALHMDCRAGERFAWLTSSGWIMWNCQWVALAEGMTVAMFDGAPNHPDMGVVWRFVAEEGLHYFGAGAAFFDACRKAGVRPEGLAALRSLGSTGSPLSDDAYDWIYRDVKPDVWLAPISGGTDFCGAFVGGNPMLPVRRGEMQCRFLGNAVRAFDEEGRGLIGQVGELVCTEPLPSMPLFFWGDADGSRLRESYFEAYPGIWRHGDWIEITPEGGAIIYGRSDATINRKGLRLGSAEIYQAVEALDFVMDSLVVDLEYLGRESFMPLFVVMREGVPLDETAREAINSAIREAVSPRFLPSEIVEVPEIPRTLSGKKLEVPVKKLLLGGDPKKVVNRDSMANPEAFDAFVAYAEARAARETG